MRALVFVLCLFVLLRLFVDCLFDAFVCIVSQVFCLALCRIVSFRVCGSFYVFVCVCARVSLLVCVCCCIVSRVCGSFWFVFVCVRVFVDLCVLGLVLLMCVCYVLLLVFTICWYFVMFHLLCLAC